MRWVTEPVVIASIGWTRDQLRGKRARGRLTRGVHFAVVDGAVMYDLEALQAWISSEASAQREPASRSAGRSEDGDIASIRIARRRRPTSRMRLDIGAA